MAVLTDAGCCSICGDEGGIIISAQCIHGHAIFRHPRCNPLHAPAPHCMGCAAEKCSVCNEFGGECATMCLRGHCRPCHAECTGITAVYCSACKDSADGSQGGFIEMWAPRVKTVDVELAATKTGFYIEYLDRLPPPLVKAWVDNVQSSPAVKCLVMRQIIQYLTGGVDDAPLRTLLEMKRGQRLPLKALAAIMSGAPCGHDINTTLMYTLRYFYGGNN